MKKLFLIFFGAFLLMHGVSSAQKTKRHSTRPTTKVYRVENVTLSVVKVNSEQNATATEELVVRAQGQALSGGWTNVKLIPTFSVKKTEDGIYRFDFVAAPPAPNENVTQALTPVSAEYVFKTIPDNIIKVIVYAENNNIEKAYAATALQPHIDVSCDESRPGTLVFNVGGDYRVVIQHLEMAKRSDASICIAGTKNCWEHLQNYTVGSGRDFTNIAEGSTMTIYSSQEKNAEPQLLQMDKTSCPPKEGFVFFNDATGFRMTLKVERIETASK